MLEASEFKQGTRVLSEDPDFLSALQIAVDYRGDTELILKSGEKLEGFLFNANSSDAEIFPIGESVKKQIPIKDIKEIHFSGRDEAQGKSWEEWVKKREAEKSKATLDAY